jgi:hypothetical protein
MKVVTSVSPAAEITLGEPLVWTVRIDHDASDTYSLPEKLDASPLALVAAPQTQRKEGAGLTTTTLRFSFADYLSTEPRIPDIPLRVEGPAGPRVYLVRGQPLQLKSLVKAEGADSAEHAHHGPKPPVDVMVRSLLWLWLLLGGAALVAAAFGLRRYLAYRKRRAAEQPVVQRSPDEEALALLDQLKRTAPWTRGEGRAAIFSLSEIFRGYLGKRLRFNALDLTSDELLTQLRARPLPGLDVAALEEELRWEDLVKFAKVEPQPEECLRAIDGAAALVARTRPVAEPGPAQEKAA